MTSALAMRRRAMGGAASGALVSDSFNRADNTATLGSADTGQAWAADQGTWGVIGNKAYNSGGYSVLNNQAAVEAGVADGKVESSVTRNSQEFAGILFRTPDAPNALLAVLNATHLQFYRKATNFTMVAQYAYATTSGVADLIAAVLSGSSIVIRLNGTDVITVTETAHQAATRHGLYADSTGAAPGTGRYEDFKVTT